MKKKILLVLTMLLCFGLGYFTKYRLVSNEGWDTFNSKKWKPYENGVSGKNYRKKMVFNLVHNVLKTEVILNENSTDINELITTKSDININKAFELLGSEKIHKLDNGNGFVVSYEVEEKYGWNIDPEGGTNLKLFFNKDSIYEYWRIEEFWYRP